MASIRDIVHRPISWHAQSQKTTAYHTESRAKWGCIAVGIRKHSSLEPDRNAIKAATLPLGGTDPKNAVMCGKLDTWGISWKFKTERKCKLIDVTGRWYKGREGITHHEESPEWRLMRQLVILINCCRQTRTPVNILLSSVDDCCWVFFFLPFVT